MEVKWQSTRKGRRMGVEQDGPADGSRWTYDGRRVEEAEWVTIY